MYYVFTEIGSLKSKIEETRQQIAGIHSTSNDIFSEIGQLNSKIEKLALPANIIYKITSANSEIEKIKSEVLEIQKAQLSARAALSTSAVFTFLGFLHEAAIAAIARNPLLKDDIKKAAIDIAEEFAKKFVGGTADELGKAFGNWLVCGKADCERKRNDVLDAANKLIEKQCENDCYKLLTRSDEVRTDQLLAKIESGIKDGFAKLEPTTTVNKPAHVSNFSPITIFLEKIGGFDDNGQASALIPELKKNTENKTGCVISVTGYTDTLGSDKANLMLSEKRADKIVDKLKDAFVDRRVQIKKEEPWGERRLKDWTPNNVAHMANRRVEINVSCDN